MMKGYTGLGGAPLFLPAVPEVNRLATHLRVRIGGVVYAVQSPAFTPSGWTLLGTPASMTSKTFSSNYYYYIIYSNAAPYNLMITMQGGCAGSYKIDGVTYNFASTDTVKYHRLATGGHTIIITSYQYHVGSADGDNYDNLVSAYIAG
jgi:hypothetical protein